MHLTVCNKTRTHECMQAKPHVPHAVPLHAHAGTLQCVAHSVLVHVCTLDVQGMCCTILDLHGQEATAADEALPFHDAARCGYWVAAGMCLHSDSCMCYALVLCICNAMVSFAVVHGNCALEVCVAHMPVVCLSFGTCVDTLVCGMSGYCWHSCYTVMQSDLTDAVSLGNMSVLCRRLWTAGVERDDDPMGDTAGPEALLELLAPLAQVGAVV